MKLVRSFKPTPHVIPRAEIIGDTGPKLRTIKTFVDYFSKSNEMESL